jgi:hypothetical protein
MRRLEVEVAWQEDKRRKRHVVRIRGGKGMTRGKGTTSNGKLELKRRQMPQGKSG